MEVLEGDAESCNATVELLVAKHPEMKAFQIGSPLFNANITDSGLQTLLTADGLTKVSLYWARLITGETLVLDSDSAQQIQDLELIYCALTKKGLLKILSICGNQLTLLDLTGSRVALASIHPSIHPVPYFFCMKKERISMVYL